MQRTGRRDRPDDGHAGRATIRVDAALTALLARDDAPTALCFHQDSLAIPLFFRLRQCGMAIPTDLSVTGFDNSTFSARWG